MNNTSKKPAVEQKDNRTSTSKMISSIFNNVTYNDLKMKPNIETDVNVLKHLQMGRKYSKYIKMLLTWKLVIQQNKIMKPKVLFFVAYLIFVYLLFANINVYYFINSQFECVC